MLIRCTITDMTPDQARAHATEHGDTRKHLGNLRANLHEAITVLRTAGVKWQEIGEMTGLGDRQAAQLWHTRETKRRAQQQNDTDT